MEQYRVQERTHNLYIQLCSGLFAEFIYSRISADKVAVLWPIHGVRPFTDIRESANSICRLEQLQPYTIHIPALTAPQNYPYLTKDPWARKLCALLPV